MTLAVEHPNSKLIDVVTFAHADIGESDDDRLVKADSLATANHVRQQLNNSFYPHFLISLVKTYD